MGMIMVIDLQRDCRDNALLLCTCLIETLTSPKAICWHADYLCINDRIVPKAIHIYTYVLGLHTKRQTLPGHLHRTSLDRPFNETLYGTPGDRLQKDRQAFPWHPCGEYL